VAYLSLPDNVWRPLFLGNVVSPTGVAVDSTNSRLYVADPPVGRIYWYSMVQRPGGLLATTGVQNLAVKGFNASWLAVNGVGDIYFTGLRERTTQPSIFKQSAIKVALNKTWVDPIEAMPNANKTAFTESAAAASGIALDSFNIYWGNKEQGSQHGSVIRSYQQMHRNIRVLPKIVKLNSALDKVTAMCCTGRTLFFVSPHGLYGMETASTSLLEAKNVSQGLINPGPKLNNSRWDPRGIAWDGDGTLYIADQATKSVYTSPALNSLPHAIDKFVDAPHISDVAVLLFRSSSRSCVTVWAIMAWTVATCVLADTLVG